MKYIGRAGLAIFGIIFIIASLSGAQAGYQGETLLGFLGALMVIASLVLTLRR